jgi:uncharacterized protein (DUF2252 family)
MSNNTALQTPTTRTEREKMGKALRRQVPLAGHSQWTPAADRPDPLALLQAQDKGRVKQLLPIKYGRMLESPFTFYRGSAVLMAADLAGTPATGLEAVLCGDAHLSNFGVFATPERRMVFDINDFDEAFPGRQLAEDTTLTYGRAMDRFCQMTTLEHWYYHVDVEAVLQAFEEQSSKKAHKDAKKMVKKARTKTQEQTLEKLTRLEDGQRRITSNPPLLVPFREMNLEQHLSKADMKQLSEQGVARTWDQYLASLPDERRYLLQRYQLSDGALRVGGIGSVGTRCAIVLLKGGAEDDALILQLKEAGPSVLEAYVDYRSPYESHAQRVVTARRLMQATSDIFLGWSRGAHTGVNYYWRQLKDMKGSADIARLDESGLRVYLGVCSWCLARAHARTGDRVQIRGYLGTKDAFAKAIGDFAVAYADQAEQDYKALVKAVKDGRIATETGIYDGCPRLSWT